MPFVGLRSIDGVLVFRDCNPISANEIKIRQGEEGDAPKDMKWVWIAATPQNGGTTVVSSVTYGVPPEGMVVSVGPDPISPESVIQFSVLRREGTTVTDARQATFHLSQLSDDEWLMASGKLASAPCT